MAFNPKFAELLGSKLLKKKGDNAKEFEEVDTIEALKEKKVIAIYFSAHWCPPCRGFTPKLADWYTASFKNLGMEVVFASSDRDEAAFKDYYGEMPWLALPYSERDLKAKLGEKFQCQGIPYLVLLGPDGRIITTNGRGAVTADTTGEKFPWPQKSLQDVIGDSFVKKGKTLSLADLKGKTIGIYFSAHWCPPCKGFTPVLAETYKKLVDQGKNFEIIFVSSDQDEKQFDAYYNEMPWACVPYADRDRKKELSDHFDVEGIPTLVILDENLKVITDSAVGAVRGDAEGKNFPWKGQPTNDIDDSCDGITDRPTLCVIQDKVDEKEQQANIAILRALGEEQLAAVAAEEAKKGDAPKTCFDEEGAERFNFFSASKKDEQGRFRTRVSDECKINKDEKKTQVVMLAIHKSGGYYSWPADTAFTKENAQKFMQDYRDGKLTRKQMGADEE